jgi:hypothetical protein
VTRVVIHDVHAAFAAVEAMGVVVEIIVAVGTAIPVGGSRM